MNPIDTAITPRTRVAAGASEWYGAMTAQVVAFLGRLRRIPAEAWARTAAADPHVAAGERPRAGAPARAVQLLRDVQTDQMARARLREVMDTMPEVVRRVRQRIDDDLAILDGIAPAAAVVRMRRAARLAALAVSARPFLSAAEFERLYRPFWTLIPPAELAT